MFMACILILICKIQCIRVNGVFEDKAMRSLMQWRCDFIQLFLISWMLFLMPGILKGQFSFTTNNGALTVAGYSGSGGAVTIPDKTNGFRITAIGGFVFQRNYSLTSISIPNTITNIGADAFYQCPLLTSVTIPDSVISLDAGSFYDCTGLTNVIFGNNLQTIGYAAFSYCSSLSSVVFPKTLTRIWTFAFDQCTGITGFYFEGNAPEVDGFAFQGEYNAIGYYLPGRSGFPANFNGIQTAFWFLPNPVILNSCPSFGIQTNGFGFLISWATNSSVVVEASTNLINHAWIPVGTNILSSGTSYFTDYESTNYPTRFYRLYSN